MQILKNNWFWMLLGIGCVFLLIYILQPLDFHILKTYRDDSFYYLGYGWNIGHGNGPTFDGIVTTNGVQPIWALLLALISPFAPDRIAYINMMMIMGAWITLLSAIPFYAIVRKLFAPLVQIILVISYFIFILSGKFAVSGMELPVTLLMILIAVAFVFYSTNTVRSTLFAGLLFALVTMARIDLLAFAPAYFLFWLYQHKIPLRFKELLRTALLLGAPGFIIWLCYTAFNYANWGLLLPISGETKAVWVEQIEMTNGQLAHIADSFLNALQHFPNLFLTIFHLYPTSLSSPIPDILQIAAILFLVLMLAIGIFALVRRPSTWQIKRVSGGLVLFVTGVLVIFHEALIFMRIRDVQAQQAEWYHASQYLFLLLLAGFVLQYIYDSKLPFKLALLRLGVASMSLLLVLQMVIQFRESDSLSGLNKVAFKQGAEWLDENIPPEDVVGSYDAGIIGYFSDHTIVNLDGLMNDGDFLQVSRGEIAMMDYLNEMGIRWVINLTNPNYGNRANFRGVDLGCAEEVHRIEYPTSSRTNELVVVLDLQACST